MNKCIETKYYQHRYLSSSSANNDHPPLAAHRMSEIDKNRISPTQSQQAEHSFSDLRFPFGGKSTWWCSLGYFICRQYWSSSQPWVESLLLWPRTLCQGNEWCRSVQQQQGGHWNIGKRRPPRCLLTWNPAGGESKVSAPAAGGAPHSPAPPPPPAAPDPYKNAKALQCWPPGCSQQRWRCHLWSEP